MEQIREAEGVSRIQLGPREVGVEAQRMPEWGSERRSAEGEEQEMCWSLRCQLSGWTGRWAYYHVHVSEPLQIQEVPSWSKYWSENPVLFGEWSVGRWLPSGH